MTDHSALDVHICPGCRGDQRQPTGRFFNGPQLWRCLLCSTEFLSPQPTDARLDEIYGPDYFEPWAISDDPSVADLKRRTFAPIIEASGARPGDALLDIGCATGVLVGQAISGGMTGYGIDLNEHAIKEARSAVPQGKFAHGLLQDDPFPGATFDAITMVDLIEHVRHPEEELRGVVERLRPGGKLVISTPRVDSMLRKILRSAWPQYREEHLSYFSRHGMEAVLQRAGLTVRSMQATTKTLNLGYIHRHAQAFPMRAITPMVRLTYSIAPFARSLPVKVRLGEMTVVATPSE